jgi:putative chitinase
MKIREVIVESKLYVDVPNDEWLQDQIDYAKSKPRNSFGAPYMGKTTAYTRQPVRVPVSILKQLPGMRGEQQNVRQDDLQAIVKIMQDTGKLPTHDGQEYVPFVNVAYNGEAWVNEGNHRIMAAAALHWPDLPVEIKYFDGGERIKSGPLYPGNINLGGLDEDWRNWAAGLGAAAMIAGGGGAAYDAYKSHQQPQPQVQQQAPQQAPQIDPQKIQQAQALLTSAPAKVLSSVAKASGIQGTELAQFMAQCAHETADFSTLKEYGGKLDFKKYDIRFNPAKAKALGNIHPGDGARYFGRGFIQLTGRYNYKRAGEALGLPLEKHPEMVEKPEVAAKVAVWFWQNHVQPNVDNFQNTKQVTKPINPGMKGLQNRHDKFVAMNQLLAQR